MSWAQFFAAVLPELSQLALALFRSHDGNAATAKAELRQMADYGAKRRQEQAALDSALAEAREKEKAK